MDFDYTSDTIVPDTGQVVTVNATGSLSLPSGTTVQRPGSPVAGTLRWNTTIPNIEWWNGTTWVQPSSSADVTSISFGTTGLTPNTATTGAVTVAGTLVVGNGGTGAVTLTAHGVLLGQGTGTVTATAVGATGSVLTGSTGADPTFTALNTLAVTSIAGTANQVTASAAVGTVTLSTPSTFTAPGYVAITTGLYESTSATVSAAGTTLATATALTASYNVITTAAANTGVTLPAPTLAGWPITIVNKGANAVNVYPNSATATINALGAGIAVSLGVGTALEVQNSTSGASATWYAVSGGPAAPTTSVQWNNGGVFGGSSAFLFTAGTNPFVTITGTTATNQMRVGPAYTASTLAAQYVAGPATAYLETNNTDQDGQLVYFNSGTPGTSGYISYAYDGSTPYLRLTDADDDAPYITFNTIGTGTYALPLYVSAFGARGTYASRTLGNSSGFSWYVGANTSATALITANTPVMELDTAFLRIPTITTANRPATPAIGMLDYNTDEDILEGYAQPYTTTISPVAFQRTALYRKRRTWVDDFISNVTATTNTIGAYGELNWTMSNSSGTNTVASLTPTTDHPGALALGTAGATGNNARLHLGSTSATTIVMANQIEYFAFLIRPVTVVNTVLRFGIGQDLTTTGSGAANFGTDAAYFQLDTSVGTSWQFITRSGGTSTTGTISVAAANTWYLLEAFYNGTNWTPVINGTVATALATNIPGAVAVNVGLTMNNLNGTARTLDIDYFAMMTREMGNRYP